MRRERRRGGCLGPFLLLLIVIAAISAGGVWLVEKNPEILKFAKQAAQELDLFGLKEEDMPDEKLMADKKEVEDKYHYSQLDEKGKTAYREILYGIQNHVVEIKVHWDDVNTVSMLREAVLNDHPEIFWCGGRYRSIGYNEGDSEKSIYCILEMEYEYNEDETEIKKREIEAAAQECLAGIARDASEYEKIKYLYEYIITTTEYSLSASDNQNIYSVFVNRRSVCAGYAKALQYLAEELGISCTYVTGTALDSPHGWNLVCIDDEYYYVDVTWGDPVFMQEDVDVIGPDHISYDYLFCTDEEIFRTHVLDPEMVVPPCKSMKYNYYMLNGMYYETFDSEVILEKMNNSILKQEGQVTFKFALPEIYIAGREQMMDDLVPKAAQKLGEIYGLNEVTYYCQENETLDRVTIFWKYE